MKFSVSPFLPKNDFVQLVSSWTNYKKWKQKKRERETKPRTKEKQTARFVVRWSSEAESRRACFLVFFSFSFFFLLLSQFFFFSSLSPSPPPPFLKDTNHGLRRPGTHQHLPCRKPMPVLKGLATGRASAAIGGDKGSTFSFFSLSSQRLEHQEPENF